MGGKAGSPGGFLRLAYW